MAEGLVRAPVLLARGETGPPTFHLLKHVGLRFLSNLKGKEASRRRYTFPSSVVGWV